jgi:hypothetical protein
MGMTHAKQEYVREHQGQRGDERRQTKSRGTREIDEGATATRRGRESTEVCSSYSTSANRRYCSNMPQTNRRQRSDDDDKDREIPQRTEGTVVPASDEPKAGAERDEDDGKKIETLVLMPQRTEGKRRGMENTMPQRTEGKSFIWSCCPTTYLKGIPMPAVSDVGAG